MSEELIIKKREPEIWKDIDGYDGFYQVSSWGRIKSLGRWVACKGGQKFNKERIRKDCNSHGYRNITLCKENKSHSFLLHIVVANAFVENPENLPQVNHLDGDKTNNYYKNLEWCTGSENMQHAADNGLLNLTWVGKSYEKHPKSKPIVQYDLSDSMIRNWASATEAANKLGMHRPNINACLLGRQKTAFGYKWKFL
jgi:hypothetical protein